MASDLALVVPASMARRYDVAVRDLPFSLPPVGLRLYWRRDARQDAAHAWAREELLAIAGGRSR
jgi:DNA-binding transcriptional LysR family regulator